MTVNLMTQNQHECLKKQTKENCKILKYNSCKWPAFVCHCLNWRQACMHILTLSQTCYILVQVYNLLYINTVLPLYILHLVYALWNSMHMYLTRSTSKPQYYVSQYSALSDIMYLSLWLPKGMPCEQKALRLTSAFAGLRSRVWAS